MFLKLLHLNSSNHKFLPSSAKKVSCVFKNKFVFYLPNQKSQSQDGGASSSMSDKRVTLRAVKNFMKIGRSRHASKERSERDSSTEDERR